MTEKGGHRLIPPFSAVLIMVALSVVGIASIPRLNVQYTRAPTGRSIQVSYALRDASAEIIEAEATSLLEGGPVRDTGQHGHYLALRKRLW